ncbi:MAG: hypothetical protein HQK84_00325 [Nitrospinae bacterium]|nr:hypothetical protein [Nitrospinota bacterium]
MHERISRLKEEQVEKIIIAFVLISFFILLSKCDKYKYGDTPYYMQISYSIMTDFDLDLRNNINDPSKIIYNGKLDTYSPWNWDVHDGHSSHLPGMSIISLPWFAVSYYTARFAQIYLPERAFKSLRIDVYTILNRMLALFTIFLGALTVIYLARTFIVLGVGKKISYFLGLLFIYSPPLPAIFMTFMTEAPATFIVVYCLYVIINQEKNQKDEIVFSCMVSFLLWLHFKYVFLLLGLWFAAYFCFSYRGRCLLLLVTSCSSILWCFHNMYMYESLFWFLSWGSAETVHLTYFQKPLAFLIDRENGIMTYSPFYLLIFSSIYAFRSNKLILLTVFPFFFAYYFVIQSYEDWMGWFAAISRYFVPILPLFFIGIGLILVEYYRNKFIQFILLFQGFMILYCLGEPNYMWPKMDATHPFWSWLDLAYIFPNHVHQTPEYSLQAIWYFILSCVTIYILFKEKMRVTKSIDKRNNL